MRHLAQQSLFGVKTTRTLTIMSEVDSGWLLWLCQILEQVKIWKMFLTGCTMKEVCTTMVLAGVFASVGKRMGAHVPSCIHSG